MSLRSRWDKWDWALLAVLLGITVIAWSRVIFSRDWSFGVEVDFIRQFYPAHFYAAESLGAGSFPLWSPYVLSGHPFFASYQTAMLYPFNLLMVGLYGLSGSSFSLKAQCGFVVFHFYLASVFAYILARELKMGRAGSMVAALTYMFCGYLVAHSGHVNQQSTAVWIPLIFFLFYRCLDRKRVFYAAVAGLTLGFALLAGHLQPLFYLCVLLLLLVVYFAIERWRGDPRKPGLLYGISCLGLTVAVAGGLAAVQLVPTYQFIGLSSRRNIPYEMAATYSLPRKQMIGLLFPHFYGSSGSNYTGYWTMWETYGYAGIVGGALGVVALLRRRKGFVVFLWVVLILSLILALGPGGFLFTALFKSGLLFNRFRDPARVLVIFGFVSSLLAGFGADYLVRMREKRANRPRYSSAVRLVGVLLAAVLSLVLACSIYLVSRGPGMSEQTRTALKSMIMPTALLTALLVLMLLVKKTEMGRVWLPAGLALLVAVDLMVLNVPWTMVRVNPDDIYGDAAASEFVAGLGGTFRVEPDANTMYKSLDNGAIYGLQKASGDDSLVIEDYYRYRGLVSGAQSPGVQLGLFHEGGLRSPLLDLMNDVYFMSRDRINPVLAEGKFEQINKVDGVSIYRNLAAEPRAWMADAHVVADKEQSFRELQDTGGEGLDTDAVVVSGSGLVEGDTVESEDGPVSVREYFPNGMVLEVDPECRGLLVVSEVLYPGWEVYVDGEQKEILRTNFLYRGVLLPGGQKSVEFRFRPASLTVGMAVSLATMGLLLIYFAVVVAIGLKRRGSEKGTVY